MKYINYPSIIAIQNFDKGQGRSQKLKEVPQNFTEVFKISDVTANNFTQRNQHRKEKKINLSSIVITDVKSAFLFFFSVAEHYHS